jgi:uncharacterized protein YbaA (DUF1428 family)
VPYVDAFVLALPKQNLEAYKSIAVQLEKFGRNSERSPMWNAWLMMFLNGEFTSFPRRCKRKTTRSCLLVDRLRVARAA